MRYDLYTKSFFKLFKKQEEKILLIIILRYLQKWSLLGMSCESLVFWSLFNNTYSTGEMLQDVILGSREAEKDE